MTNLSRLTLAAALLGGMALPAFAQAAAVQDPAPAATSKLHHRVAATEAATSKDAVTKDPAMKAAPAAPAKEAPGATSKDVTKDTSKDVTKDVTKDASKTAGSVETVKPVAPGQTSLTPATQPKVN